MVLWGLGGSWGGMGNLGYILERTWGLLGGSWTPLGPSWGPLGALLGASWGVLGPLEGVLGASWVPLGVSWPPRCHLTTQKAKKIPFPSGRRRPKLVPKWDQKSMLTSRGRFYKSTYKTNRILMIFEVSGFEVGSKNGPLDKD